MVPLALLLVLPLVAADGHDMDKMKDMMEMMEMMEMMNKMNEMKGWGGAKEEPKAEDNAVQVMQSAEDYEAYLKWCEENKARQAEFEQQQKLLDQFKEREAAKKEEERVARLAMEAEERKHNMMAEWKMWEKQMASVASYDKLGYEIMEMKGKYYHLVAFEFLKFCKCTDFTSEIEALFMGGHGKADEFDLDIMEDIASIDSNDPAQVAQALAQLSKGDQIKAFFGGLAEAMCDGAEQYFEQVEAWEKQYNFLERLH